MYNPFFFHPFFIFVDFDFFPFTSVLSATDDGFLSVNPEDCYNLEDYGKESNVSNQLHEEYTTSDQNALSTEISPLDLLP